jgi:tRNA-specific 2-thiouridylase
LEASVEGGDYIFKGKKVGKHRGYPFYTIGQRKGLDLAMGDPVFVKEIIPETNTVVLGDLEDLKEMEINVRDFNLIKYETLPQDYVALTKIRYKDAGRLSTINKVDDKLNIVFHESATGIAPGQSAVIYEGDDLIGGGFIDRKPLIFQ